MEIEAQSAAPALFATQALVVLAPEQEGPWAPPLEALERATQGWLSKLKEAGEISGRWLESTLLHHPPGLKAERLLLLGCGKNPTGPFELRRLAGTAARLLKAKGVKQMALALPPEATQTKAATAAALPAAIAGAWAANFETGAYKSDRQPEKRIERLTLLVPATVPGAEIEPALNKGQAIAAAVERARELANQPANYLTPRRLGEEAEALARRYQLEFELLDEARARELRMGAFLSVAQGSAEPPRMIVLRYRGAAPSDPGKARRVLGLVGKGITFDTGGISIKPADGMEKMKYDMTGGATMLAVMQALAQLQPRLEVIAVIPAAENMPGSRAQKPGDVQIAMSGKSIEVLNTDAEGRLVLADGLSYARQLGATHLVDVATLTGAVAVALGAVYAGAFANQDEFYHEFEQAAAAAGEKVWRLPLDEEYRDQIRGSVGDLLNSGGRYGGAITAAEFLHAFAEDTPWIHLDIAGTAWWDEGKAWMPKGPTGIAVASLVELALRMAEA